MTLKTINNRTTHDNATLIAVHEDFQTRSAFDPVLIICIGASICCFCILAIIRYCFFKRKLKYHNKWMSRIVPKPYVAHSGSVWSLKRYQYSYPSQIEVIAQPNARRPAEQQ